MTLETFVYICGIIIAVGIVGEWLIDTWKKK